MLSLNHIRTQVAAINKRSPEASVIGLQSASRWTGEPELRVDGTLFLVRFAETELEMRSVLVEPRPDQSKVVVLTNLQTGQIGEDLLAQFARRRFFTLSAAEILMELFQARQIDPRLQQLRWMASALADMKPSEGYPPSPQGGLDQETAWGVYLEYALHLKPARPDLAGLLVWARLSNNVTIWRALDTEVQSAIKRWLEPSVGIALDCILAAIAGPSAEALLSLGLVADILYQQEEISVDLATARGKFERHFGDQHISVEQGRQLAAAAKQAVSQSGITNAQTRADIERADELLKELRIESHAINSDFSFAGFSLRLASFGNAIRTYLAKGTPEQLQALSGLKLAIQQHRCAKEEPDRVERVDMALRLCRWLGTQTRSLGQDFKSLAKRYAEDESFVDWARQLLYHGDSQSDLNLAYKEIVARAGEERERSNRSFATSLDAWSELGSSSEEILLIEDVVANRLAAIAAKQRTLFLVLDGMSFAVYRQLIGAVINYGWTEVIPDSTAHPATVIAGLPTITEWSRRLLISGRPDITPGADETAAFRDSTTLARVTKTSHPPILFSKGDLTEPNARDLSEAVRKEIASPQRQIVGVIINAIDDHLTKDDQLHVAWSPDRIPLFQQLLGLARGANRTVILTSDHGHILAHNGRLLKAGTSDRFRGPTGAITEEELHLNKGRARGYAKEGFVAPWSERIYYTSRRNGFHGGVSPQEVLVPATVLIPGSDAPDGWHTISQSTPAWWWDALPEKPVAAAPEPTAKKTKKASIGKDTLPLFEEERQPTKNNWIDTLLLSPLYTEQRNKSGRTPPADDAVRKILSALDERNGTILKTALAQRIGEPEFRINGILAVLRRILNVEGYPVLHVDESSGTVRLDQKLLRTQFELK